MTRLLLAICAVSVPLNSAFAAPDLDNDGKADEVSYRCSLTGCTFSLKNSSDGSRYEVQTGVRSAGGESVFIDPITGALSMRVGSGIVVRALPDTDIASQPPVALSRVAMAQSAFPSLQSNDINGFLNNFCVNVKIPNFDPSALAGSIENSARRIMGMLDGLLKLLDDPTSILTGGGNPAACFPGIDITSLIPGFNIGDISACINRLPNIANLMSGIGSCLQNLASYTPPSIPNVNPAAIEQCLKNQIPGLNIPSLDPGDVTGNIIGELRKLLSQLDSLKAAYPSDLKASLDWLKNYCRLFQTNSTGIANLGVGSSASRVAASFSGSIKKGKATLKASGGGSFKCSIKKSKITCKLG